MALTNTEYNKAITFGSVTDADATDGLESEFGLIETGFSGVAARVSTRAVRFSEAISGLTNASIPGLVGFDPADGDSIGGPFASGSMLPWPMLAELTNGFHARAGTRAFTGGAEAWFLPAIDNENWNGYWTTASVTGAPQVFGGLVPIIAPATFPVPVLVMFRCNILVSNWQSDANVDADFGIGQWSDNNTIFQQPMYKSGVTSNNQRIASDAYTKQFFNAGVLLLDEDDGVVHPIAVKHTLGGDPDYDVTEAELFLMVLGAADSLADRVNGTDPDTYP